MIENKTSEAVADQEYEDNLITFDKQVRLVCFKLSDQEYAADAADTIEILRLVAITAIPEAPAFVPGIINLRGEIIPIVDLRLRFGFKQQLYNLNTPIIVAKNENRTIGLIVDQVTEVINLSSSQVSADEVMPNARYVKGVAKYDDRLLLITDLNDLFNVEEEKALQKALNSQEQEKEIEIKDLPKTG